MHDEYLITTLNEDIGSNHSRISCPDAYIQKFSILHQEQLTPIGKNIYRGIIKKLLSVTNYRTTPYTRGVSILDISASSGEEKGEEKI